MNMHYIIFSKRTVERCKERRTYCCKPFFLNSWNIFLGDSLIFSFIDIIEFRTAHMMT